MRAARLALLTILLGVSPSSAEGAPLKPITLSIYPQHFGFAPLDLRVQVVVPRHAANRLVTVFTDGGDYVRASQWDLEGENAPAIVSFYWKALTEGEYVITAELYGSHGMRGRDQTTLSVK